MEALKIDVSETELDLIIGALEPETERSLSGDFSPWLLSGFKVLWWRVVRKSLAVCGGRHRVEIRLALYAHRGTVVVQLSLGSAEGAFVHDGEINSNPELRHPHRSGQPTKIELQVPCA
jgi:hypothetical protein